MLLLLQQELAAQPTAEPVPRASRRHWVATGLLTLGPALTLALVVRRVLLDAQSGWLDEGYSLAMARGPLGAVIRYTAYYDTHPPPHYILLHAGRMARHSVRLPAASVVDMALSQWGVDAPAAALRIRSSDLIVPLRGLATPRQFRIAYGLTDLGGEYAQPMLHLALAAEPVRAGTTAALQIAAAPDTLVHVTLHLPDGRSTSLYDLTDGHGGCGSASACPWTAPAVPARRPPGSSCRPPGPNAPASYRSCRPTHGRDRTASSQ